MSEPSSGPLPAGSPPEAAGFGFDLARRVAEIGISRDGSELRDQLHRIADAVAASSGIERVLVVALDEEETPLTSGSVSLSLSSSGSELEGLFRLHEVVEPKLGGGGWIEIPRPVVSETEEIHCLALPLRVPGAGAAGLVLVGLPWQGPSPETLRTLEDSSAILAAAIQSAIRAQAWSRIEALQRLAQETFSGTEERTWDLQALVQRLAGFFDADAVTLLLKDQDELRLSASTDPQLGRGKPVVYLPGQGLTGHVFQSCQGFRLSNTEDCAEIRRVTGLERAGPLHPERDQEGFFTGQFLGVPMRFGGKAVGVLRMSRREGVARFTQEDQNALQLFADLLGAALAPSWNLLVEKSVLESVTEAIAVTRRASRSVHRIVMANPGAERLLGRSRAELEGMDVREIYDPAELGELWPELRSALDQGLKSCGPFATQMRRADGTPIPITVSYRFLVNDLVKPPTLYTVGLARDRSEPDRLAAQHKRMLKFLETLGIAYFRADHQGLTQESTPRDSIITGYSPEELKVMPRTGLFGRPEDRERLLTKARNNDLQVSREVVQMRRKDRTPFWAEGDLRILVDTAGREIGSEGFYRDVTERRALQRFLNEDTERILSEDELFERLKEEAAFHLDYLSSLGHQLQTPLSSLIQTLKSLEKGVAGQREIVERLPYVIGQAVVCQRLVRNLSYMDQILRGAEFKREWVSMAKLAIETKLDFLHLLREKRLELTVDDDSLSRVLQIQGHAEMLRQVVVNLVDNAIKYSVPGSSIHIRARRWEEGPTLEITNLGLPIPKDEREKIFQRGHRTEKARAYIPHGTGLGLWLVSKILKAHGATIRFYELDRTEPKRNLFCIHFRRTS